MTPYWRVLAIRYATAQLPAAHLDLDADVHDAIGTLDYFIWVVSNGDRHIVVDTGFEPEEGARRGRQLIRHPVESLRLLGIDPDAVSDVILTHLHYDHAGNLGTFTNARFHLQDAEMEYATGRCMCHPRMRRPFCADDVTRAVRLVYEGRLVFHDGDFAFAPGLGVHRVGGHSRGLQVVRAEARGRPVVIASDALHLGHYLADGGVFPMFADYGNVLEGYQRLRQLAGDSGLILPGHDPGVLTRFAPVRPEWPDVVEVI
ncbi:MAG: N-acyl homoserine lactonase family protein [Mesorhizobium sp.]|uniref:N-acyl homoserine lactonase family protein n=1 Tax=Mesorhizobium sp. TaxID=1871066 RepID=UPI001ACD18DF|nr:N-acyl homoserine lactonase family protein [Mesorhizobium sp.]MBN9217271.1 N-acyl homoserine lactonase family protein [Mesorhizobium sp.]